MKKIFTKTLGIVAAFILFVGIALPSHAQFVKGVYENNNEFYTALAKDPNGNIYAIRTADAIHGSVVKYAPHSTTFTTIFTGLDMQTNGTSETNAGFLPWGLAVNSRGDVYLTTNLNPYNKNGFGTNIVNGTQLGNHGNVIKLASNNGFNGTSYTASVFLNGGLFYSGLAFDASDNLYVLQTDDTNLSHYVVEKYLINSLTGVISTTGAELFNDLNDAATDNYPHGIVVAPNLDIFVCDAGQQDGITTSGDKGKVKHYVYSSAGGGTYPSQSSFANNYPMAVGLDPSGNLYVSETDGTAYANYRLNKYNPATNALITGNIASFTIGAGIAPDGIAAVNSHDIYVLGGGNPSEFSELIGPATTAASGITFTATTATTTTINWTNGDGDTRAVFVALTSTGTPTLTNSTNYGANTAFGSGTQAGAGWYCVYNGTGTSVNVTGLTTGNTYRAMVVEYNGTHIAGTPAVDNQNYFTTSNAGNTANVTIQIPTTITSLNTVTGTVTNAANVSYTAVFSSAITGVTASNFSVTTTGVSGVTNANIGTPTSVDNITWTVPVTTGTGDGTIQLNLANATGLSKTISTSLPFAGQSYTIDKTSPTISIGSPSATGTNSAGSVSYTVTYSDANFNSSTLASGNITLNTTGTASGTPVVTGSGLTRTVTISGITGEGTLGISIAAGTATDLATNSAPAAGPSTTFTVDNTAPTISIGSPSVTLANSSTSVTYTVTYADANFNGSTLATGNITLNTTGGAGGSLAVTGSGLTRTVTISSLTGNGTIGISIAAGTATDVAGNAAPAAGPSSTFTVDQTAPTVTSINIAGTSPTLASSVDYTVTFSEPVTGVDVSDFTVTQVSGNVSGTVSNVNGSGTTYTVTVGSINGEGDLRLDLNSSGTGILDLASNPIATGFITGQTYTIDHTPPTLTSGSYFSNNGFSSQYAKVGDQITLSIGYNEPLQSLTMTINGNPVSVTPSNGNRNWTGVYTTTSADVEGNVPWTLSATDLAGNVRNYANTDFGTVLIFDKTPPAVTSITATGTNPTNSSSLTYTVTFSESVMGVDATDFTITTTNNPALTTTGISSITGGGNTYTVTIGGVTGDGTVRLDLNSSGTGITDIPGNPIGGGFTTGDVYTIDNTPPGAVAGSAIFVSSNANVRAAKVGDVITLSFTTTEPIQTPTITIDGHSVTPSNPSGNDWTTNYTMTSSDTEGPVSFDVQAQDLAGNTVDISSAALPPQFVITFDKTDPAITIGAPSVASINSGTGNVTYTVTYADANLNAITLAPGDITLNTTGDATGTVSVVNSTSSSTVTISGITGSGSLGISIAAGTAADVAGNLAPATGASATFAVILNTENITFNALPTKTYGDLDFAPGATSDNNGPAITYSSDNTAVATIVAGNIHIVGAGSANITASQAGDATHSAAIDQIQPLTVNAAPLTITADNKTKAYGDAIPTLTASYTGFVNGDDASSLTTTPTLTTTATAASHVAGSPYAITASGAVDPNYTISYVPGPLTITAAPLTITPNNQNKAYGDAIPTLTVSYAGLVNGDDGASLTTPPTLTTTATAASTVAGNPYAITASGAVDADYSISYIDGNLTVTAAPLTATADNQSSTYGQALPALTVSYAGFVNGDTQASLTTTATASTPATAASPAGSYTITPSGAVDNNYQITYTNGTLTIGQAALTATADNQNSTYGQALPALTVSYAGFVNGDTQASLTTTATASTPATAASPAGSYTITPSGAVDNNYQITYTNGTLTIGQAALTATADNQSSTYGQALPALTVSYAGFVNGDTQASLTTTATASTPATAASPAGSYTITPSGAVDNNYQITYTNGTLTIGQAALTATADNQSSTYGQALPALTVSYAGFVNGDTQASLTTAATASTPATAASPAGSYTITPPGAVDNNYQITYTNGTLTIGQTALTVMADNQTKAYGDAIPTLTASYSGFVNGDNAASLATAPMIATTATMGSSVTGSPYPITASGAVDPNYTISYVPGNLTIGAVPLTITANNQTKTAGTANPPLTVNYTGFVNGDSNTNLTTQPVVSTTAITGSPAGPYPITANGAADANYTISYVAGTLTVAPVGTTGSVIAFAPIAQQTYGNTDFAPGATSNNNVTPVTYTSDNTAVATIVSGKVHIVGAGTANITAMQTAGGTFTAASNVIEQLKVVPSALIITANNQTKIAGTANPPLTVSYTGFVNGDANTNLATQPVVTTTATTGSPAGPYPITASGAVDANYTISYVAGTLTINPVGSTSSVIAFAPIAQQTYGNTDFAPGATSNNNITPVTYTSDNTTVATIVSGKVHIVGAGTANITAMQAAGGTFTTAANVIEQLKVVPEAITVTANAQSKTSGQPDPALTYAVTTGALVGTDTFTGALIRVAGENPGTYAIKQGTLALSNNYTLTYISADLVIGQKVLTITVANQTKVYGVANPALTVSYSGFVNGDTQASLTTKPTISTIAVTGSGAGIYPVTASGAAIAGYTIVYVPGTLTVTRAVLTVTADNQTRNYGEANPALSVAYSGFVNGDDIASLISPAVAATTATATTAPGSYPITADGAVSANYSFNYVAGTLVIKPLTNANLANLTLSSGILKPGFDTGTLTYTSFVENSADQITLTPTLSDPTATVRVNGTLTGSGTSSADIPLSVGSNVITVEVTAQDGVTKLDYTVTVTRDESILAITATNILTPNGDGKNDTWVIQDIQHYPNNSVIIYDRAGRVVYNKNGYTNDWGGTLGGVPLNEGTYYYVVNLGPGLRTFKGYISILRSN